MDQQQFQMFSLLIHTIAKMMTSSEVQRVKRELEGHISKEGLARIKNGKSLMVLITDCGFFNENKLMFFKKILNKSRLHEAEGILSEYIARRKISNEALNHGKRLLDMKTEARLNSLENSIQRRYTAIKYKNEQLECENEEIDQKRLEIEMLQEGIKLEEQALKGIIDRRSNRCDQLVQFKNLHDEISNLMSQNDRNKSQLIEEITSKEAEIKLLEKSTFKDEVVFHQDLNDQAIEKIRKSIGRLRKEVLIVAKESERMEYKLNYVNAKNERFKDTLSIIEHEKITKMKSLVDLDNKLIRAKEWHCQKLRKIWKIELEVIELEGAMEENKLEKERTTKQGLKYRSEFLIRAYRKIEKRMASNSYRVLDYSNIDEMDSYTLGESGSRITPLQFSSPTNVIFNKNGSLLVLDKGNKRIVCTDALGNNAQVMIDCGKVFEPVDMSVNQKGLIYLISSSLIKIFTEKGEFVFQFLPCIDSNDELPHLTGISFNIDDDIFLCDSANRKIQCFTGNGEFLRFIRLDDSFFRPNKLTVIGRSELVISDDMDNNLKILDVSQENCTKPRQIGRQGVCLNEFIQPCSVALDRSNNILIADSGNHRIQVLSIQDAEVATFGRLGSRPGCLDKPSDVSVHPCGFVAVADTGNDRVVVFS